MHISRKRKDKIENCIISISPLNLMGVVAHHLQLAIEYRGVSKNFRNCYKIINVFTDLYRSYLYLYMSLHDSEIGDNLPPALSGQNC